MQSYDETIDCLSLRFHVYLPMKFTEIAIFISNISTTNVVLDGIESIRSHVKVNTQLSHVESTVCSSSVPLHYRCENLMKRNLLLETNFLCIQFSYLRTKNPHFRLKCHLME